MELNQSGRFRWFLLWFVVRLEILEEQTFNRLAIIEAHYRKMDITPNDVLNDTYQTCLCVALRGADGVGNFEELVAGINRVKNIYFQKILV